MRWQTNRYHLYKNGKTIKRKELHRVQRVQQDVLQSISTNAVGQLYLSSRSTQCYDALATSKKFVRSEEHSVASQYVFKSIYVDIFVYLQPFGCNLKGVIFDPRVTEFWGHVLGSGIAPFHIAEPTHWLLLAPHWHGTSTLFLVI